MPAEPLISALRHNFRLALRRGDNPEAEEILGRLKKEDPLSCETRGLELEFYLRTYRLREASALADQLCHLFPESGRIHFLCGQTAYRLQQYARAESCFRESHRVFPHWRTQHWLGKTLTQLGRYDEAEALLLSSLERTDYALLDLAWLHERKNELESALQRCEEFLERNPENDYAAQQRIRIRARMLEPDMLIEEVETLSEMGEEISDALLPEYVARLFATGRGSQAREEVSRSMDRLDVKLGIRLAWICYRARAYDLACALFLAHLHGDRLPNFKYLSALETSARRSNRLDSLLEAYRRLTDRFPQLHGRIRSLNRRSGPSG